MFPSQKERLTKCAGHADDPAAPACPFARCSRAGELKVTRKPLLNELSAAADTTNNAVKIEPECRLVIHNNNDVACLHS